MDESIADLMGVVEMPGTGRLHLVGKSKGSTIVLVAAAHTGARARCISRTDPARGGLESKTLAALLSQIERARLLYRKAA